MTTFFIQEKTGKSDSAGYHLRHMEGDCYGNWFKWFKFRS